jgi:hypothetical protein
VEGKVVWAGEVIPCFHGGKEDKGIVGGASVRVGSKTKN